MRACILVSIATVFGVLASGSCAAATAKILHRPSALATNFPDDSISIVTEGISGISGREDDRIGELARFYASAGLTRLLPVTGLGPITNARDLLNTRGIDLAVFDADIRAYARIDGSLSGAGTRLAQVMKLYDKTVYIIATPDVRSLSDLAEQKVLTLGEDSDGHVTARVAFKALGIDVKLASADLAAATTALTDNTAKALILVSPPADNPLAAMPRDKGLHLLAVPESEALDKVYERTSISDEEAAGLAPHGGVPTLRVATLLATYTWQPNVYRYGEVQRFLHALPQVIAGLRAGPSSAFWRSIDAQAQVPDWQPYDAAAAILASIPPGVAAAGPSVTASGVTSPSLEATTPVATPRPAKAAVTSATPPPVVTPLVGGIELVATPIPGLADAAAPGGGLLAELVTASLPGEQVRLTWAKDAVGGVEKMQTSTGARLGLGWRRPDCAGLDTLSADDKSLCDRFQFSKPVFQALEVFFVRRGSDFTFDRDEQVAGRSICAATGADTAALDAQGRQWLKQDLLTLLRRPSLAECFAALDHGDVDAVFSDEMTAQLTLDQVGLTDRIGVVDRAVAVRELTVAADKTAPNATELIARLEAGLAALKASGRYADVVMSRMRHEQLSGGEQVLR